MQTFSSKHPVALPKKHTLLTFIAHSAYQRVQHNEVKKTLTTKYWITGGRSLVQSIIQKCVTRKTIHCSSFLSFHVNKAPPFIYRALNFVGPLYLKNKGHSSSSKVWICLIWFSTRRGLPLPDNTKTFKAAVRLIRTILYSKEVHVRNSYTLESSENSIFSSMFTYWWKQVAKLSNNLNTPFMHALYHLVLSDSSIT